MEKLAFALYETAKLSAKVAVPFAFPWAVNEQPRGSVSLPTFGLAAVLDFSQSSMYAVLFNLCFNL